MKISRVLSLMMAVALSGCASVGTVGMITKSTSDPLSVAKTTHTIKELGPAEGKACRSLTFGVFPFGNSDLQTAVDKALEKIGGDALVNVAASSSLYGFFPIYSVFSITCTTVRGTAVKLNSEK